MNDFVVEESYKKTLIEKQFKIFSYYLFIGFLFLLIFFSAFVLEKFSPTSEKIIIVPRVLSENITVKQGYTLKNILSDYQVSYTEILNIIELTKDKIDLKHLNIGQIFEIIYEPLEQNQKQFVSLSIQSSPQERLLVEKLNGQYQLKIIPIVFKTSLITASGTIVDSIITSALKAGIPLKNVMELINYYSYEIDFQRDLRVGDKFQVIYEKITSEDNKQTLAGKTMFANLILRGQEYKMYRFKPNDGPEDFFDVNNSSIKKPLLRTPVQSSRISSKFGIRKHPILGYSLMHRGIDFAAASGTPIYAAGKGTVVEIGHKGSYGKYIKIRHNNELYTAYAHAVNFAKGIRYGSKVSQGETIAYVGSTGRASGPHLHYEIIHRGQQIDPLKFKLPSYTKLKGENLEQFKKVRMELDELIKQN
ncbi:MAG: peptidoglycan DD-metalloendopeptidase family protein [Rickettsiales bacterium]|nr:peptidoglycan DD-metalloendopeptidase family protein [Rickettsiales bacterium]